MAKKKQTGQSESLPIRTYRLLRGGHMENDPQGIERVYKRGDVFESTSDLLRFNAGPNSMKFEEIGIPPVVTKPAVKSAAPSSELTSYTIEELKMIADDEEIDISACTTKTEVETALQDGMRAKT